LAKLSSIQEKIKAREKALNYSIDTTNSNEEEEEEVNLKAEIVIPN